MKLRPNCGSDRAFVWYVMFDFADEETKGEMFAIKFANAESEQNNIPRQITILNIYNKLVYLYSFSVYRQLSRQNFNACTIPNLIIYMCDVCASDLSFH